MSLEDARRELLDRYEELRVDPKSERLVVADVQRLWVVGHLSEDPVPTRYFPEGVYSDSFQKYIKVLEEPQELVFRLGGKRLLRGHKVNKIGEKGVYLKTYYNPTSESLTDKMIWPGWYGEHIWR